MSTIGLVKPKQTTKQAPFREVLLAYIGGQGQGGLNIVRPECLDNHYGQTDSALHTTTAAKSAAPSRARTLITECLHIVCAVSCEKPTTKRDLIEEKKS